MSKDFYCKACKNGRCADCRGYRNGNRKLPCLCRHKYRDHKPPRTPQRSIPLRPNPYFELEVSRMLARMLVQRRLPPEVSIG